MPLGVFEQPDSSGESSLLHDIAVGGPPTVARALVARPRLAALLHGCLQGAVTIISAPAGYGKTGLASDFARSLDRPVCWCTLDETDGQGDHFHRRLLAALKGRFPAFQIGGQVQPSGAGEAPDVHDLASSLASALSRGVPGHFMIVIDDLHHLDENQQALDLLGSLLVRLPAGCHVMLLSRTWPDLTTLPLLMARQQVGRVDTSHLAFTEDEVAQMMEMSGVRTPNSEDTHRLWVATEGWPAALVLALDPGGGRNALMPTGIFDQFLDIEIWSGIERHLQEFALATAVLRDLDPEVCAGLLGTKLSQALEALASLERKKLCVSDSQSERLIYRYNSVFNRYLNQKLRTQQPDSWEQLNCRAAILCADQGDWQGALHHYSRAGAWSEVAGIIDVQGSEIARSGRWPELTEWIDLMPSEQMEARPRVLVWRARLLQHMSQTDQALQVIDSASSLLAVQGDWAGLVDALVVQAICLREIGDYAGAIAICNKAHALVAQHGGSVASLTEVRKELGITFGMAGQLEQAVRELRSALETYEAKGDSANIAHVCDQLGVAYMVMGKLSESVIYLEKAGQRWRKLNNGQRLVQTLNNLGNLYCLQGEYDRSEAALRDGLRKAEEQGFERAQVYFLSSLADLHRQRGQYKDALEMYTRCRDLGHELEIMYVAIHAGNGQANCYRLLGDLNQAEVIAGHAMAEAEDKGGVFEMGICHTTLGLIDMDKGEAKAAVACFERSVDLLAKAEAKQELARAYFHLGEVYYKLHRKSDAVGCLQRVASLVQELGHAHFLASVAARTPELVQYATARRIGDGLYQRLQHLMRGPAGVGSDSVMEEGEGSDSERHQLAAVRARCLGGMEVIVDGRRVTDLEWRSEKSKEMFFYLLSNPRPLRKEEIVAALWPDLPEEKCNSAFHSTLYRLRQAIYSECVIKQDGRYLLNPRGRFSYDAGDFQKLARLSDETAGDPARSIELAEKALALYRGSFASEFYSDWVDTLRWHLDEQSLRIASKLATHFSKECQHQRAAEIYRNIVVRDEYNDKAWYRLIQAYLHAGESEVARHCYQRYESVMRELGEDPELDFDAICARVRPFDK